VLDEVFGVLPAGWVSVGAGGPVGQIGASLLQRQGQVTEVGGKGRGVLALFRCGDMLCSEGEGAQQVHGSLGVEQAQGHGGGDGVPAGRGAAGGQVMPVGQCTEVVAQIGGVFDVVEDEQPAGMPLQPQDRPRRSLLHAFRGRPVRAQPRGEGGQAGDDLLGARGVDPPHQRVAAPIGVGVVQGERALADPAQPVNRLRPGDLGDRGFPFGGQQLAQFGELVLAPDEHPGCGPGQVPGSRRCVHLLGPAHRLGRQYHHLGAVPGDRHPDIAAHRHGPGTRCLRTAASRRNAICHGWIVV
jgi:hypothetical protein